MARACNTLQGPASSNSLQLIEVDRLRCTPLLFDDDEAHDHDHDGDEGEDDNDDVHDADDDSPANSLQPIEAEKLRCIDIDRIQLCHHRLSSPSPSSSQSLLKFN